MKPLPAEPAVPSGARLSLLAILALGLALRLFGLGFGLPLELRPDEAFYRNAVSGMVATGDPNPHLFAYPGLPLHALLGVHAVTHAAARGLGAEVPDELVDFTRDVTIATWIQRLLSCLLGTATILLVHRLGRRIGGELTGLVAALIFAGAHLPVREAHFGVIDTPATFFVVLALLAVVRAIAEGRDRDFLLAGIACGLATAMRYTPALLGISVAVAAFSRQGRTPEAGALRPWLRRTALAAVTMIATFLATCPYTLLAWEEFRAEFSLQAAVSTGADRSPGLAALQKHLELSLGAGLGVPVLVAAGLGLLLLLTRPRLPWLSVLAFALAYLTLIATSAMDFIRYALPLAPIIALLAAAAIARLAQSLSAAAPLRVAVIVALLVLAPSLWRSVEHDLLLARPTSFELTRRFIDEELAASDRVVFTSPWFQRKIGLEARETPYDPRRILYGKAPTWLVEASHPHPHWERTEGVEDLLRAADAEVVEEISVLSGADWPATTRFDDKDSFYYPFDGLGGVRRGGPRVSLWRITPTSPPTTTPPPPAPPLQVLGFSFRDQLALGWTPKPEGRPLAWALRFATKEELEAERIPAPRFVPAGLRRYVFHGLDPGTYWVAVSAVGIGGEGPMQSFGPVEVGAPPR